jgi:UDP-glucose 4-epimerase
MRARRILITGLSSQLGGRLAQALEREPELEAIIGVDTDDPRHELRRSTPSWTPGSSPTR